MRRVLKLFIAAQQVVARWRKNEAGATAMEYGLIVALLSFTVIGAASIIGGGTQQKFETVQAAIR